MDTDQYAHAVLQLLRLLWTIDYATDLYTHPKYPNEVFTFQQACQKEGIEL